MGSPVATERLKAACGLLSAGGARGTGFLVSPELLLTCHHVVRDAITSRIVVRFRHGPQEAMLELVDEANDCALLRLKTPVAASDALPLLLASAAAVRGAAWDGYGFPAATGQAGLLIEGHIQDPSGQDLALRRALVLRSANITAGSRLHGFSGSPVLVDGAVIGQMRQIVPDAAGGAQFSIVFACPASILAELAQQRVTLPAARSTLGDRGWTDPPGPPSVFHVPQALHSHFTGRQDTLDALEQTLAATPIVALWGLGGMGKTQTALALAQRVAAQSPSTAVLWVSGDSASQFLHGLFELGKPLSRAGRLRVPYDERDATTVQKSVLDYLEQAADYLLICDNVDAPLSLRPVWPQRFGGRLLLTSRSYDVRRLGAVVIELGKLPEEDARRYLGDCHPPRGAGEQEALAQLAHELDGLPLALAQAAAFLSEHQSRYADYLHQYRKQHLDLLEQGLPLGYPRSVATTWAMSLAEVERCDPASIELLKLCALLDPNAIPEELLARSLPHDDHDDALALDRALKPLLNHSLIQRDREGRLVSMHRLVRHALLHHMEENEQRRLASTLATYLDALFPHVRYENWSQCRRLQPHILQLLVHDERLGLFERTAARAFEQAGYFLGEQGQHAAAEALFRRALLICEKTLGAEHPSYAASLNSLARFLRGLGRLDEAEQLCRQAMTIWERALGPEDPKVAFALNNVGMILHARRKLDEAEPLLRRALQLRERCYPADHLSISYSLHNLGQLLVERGERAEAERLLRRAVAIREQQMAPGNPEVARALQSLGSLLLSMDRHQEAEPFLHRALQIQERAFPAENPQLQVTRRAIEELQARRGRAGGSEVR
ncbi:MAG: tetratricopeptide repeat protein [Polyangia bacterium]